MSSDKQNVPMIKKPFTRVIVLKSDGKDDFVARMCAVLGCEYVVVRHGLGTQIAGSDTPAHGCLLLTIPGPGSFRMIDRDQSTFLVVSGDGLEVQQDRWTGMRFEAVDMYPRACRIRYGEKENDSEIRFGRASGTVPPYTPDGVSEEQEEVALPGISFHTPEEDYKEYRERLREERDLRSANILEALRTTHQSRTLGRIHGIRNSELTTLRPPAPPTLRRGVSSSNERSADRTPTPPKLTAPTYPAAAAPRAAAAPPPIPSVKRVSKTAPQEAESQCPKFTHEYDQLAERAFESLLEDDPNARFSYGGAPETVGLFSQCLGTYEVDPLMLPAYEIDQTKNRYKYVGMKTSSQLNALVCDDRVYFVPSAS
uniref:Non-structural protein NS2 n=1 Tax=Kemerovo virus TaxID=40064 RepID=A0A5S9H6W4_9REOV|nr:nonstructural protein 2 [Kemerovo virus]